MNGILNSKRLTPAMLALIIQGVTLALVTSLSWLLLTHTTLSLTVMAVVIAQGCLALLISSLCGMAAWWRAIQFVFPIMVWLMLGLHLSAYFYLAGFLITLSMYWTTFRTQVPFYPSGPRVWQQVEAMLPQGRTIHMIDIGSGLGGLVMHMAKARPESAFCGIEVAPLPWLISIVRARLKGSAAGFLLGDYHRLDFSHYDIVFAYLSPVAMPALWQKAQKEMRQGSMLLSYEFDIPGATSAFCLAATEDGPSIFGWQF
ncbi:MAG: class I SAM-dependent methyltransferase [Methylophilaceae bacterium]